MPLYDIYQPFRNYIRQFPLEESLSIIWHYIGNISDGHKLPAELIPKDIFSRPLDLKTYLLPWELEILAREIVLNASVNGSNTFRDWNKFGKALNWIRQLSEQLDPVEGEDYDVMLEMRRIIHQQFPFQTPPSAQSIIRYYKIFGGEEMSPLVEQEFGMTPPELMLIAFAVSSGFLSRNGLKRTQSYESIGLPDAIRDAYINRVSSSLEELKMATREAQAYGRDWAYTFNPLRAKPLISFDPNYPDRLLCPIPHFLMRRFTEGLFYDLRGQMGFENAYGFAFQRYVGEVLEACCSTDTVEIISEQKYKVRKNLKHGVDWIIQDKEGTIFVECKTKRLTHDAKFGAEMTAFHDDIETMANYICKHYSNIVDALNGLTNWKPRENSAYALICTLEDWWIFNPTIVRILDDAVKEKMISRQIDIGLLEKIPYSIASISEMELAFQIINSIGISDFMDLKNSNKHRESAMSPFFRTEFPREMSNAKKLLFEKDFQKLLPSKIKLVTTGDQRGAKDF